MQDIKKMTVPELKEMAKTLGVKNFEKSKKAELVELVLKKLDPSGKGEVTKKPTTLKTAKAKAKTKAKEATASKSKSKSSSSKTKDKSSVSAEIKEESNVKKLPEVNNNYDALDSGIVAGGLLEIMPDGFGFTRDESFMPGPDDVYISSKMIKDYGLRSGDFVKGTKRIKDEKFGKYDAMFDITEVNGMPANLSPFRPKFEDLTPIFPNDRIRLETYGGKLSMRLVDLISPIGKGQRGMIVSPPKAGKTTLIKDVAKAITKNNPDTKLIVLLIDERPEEVTDIKESIEGKNVDVIFSTFDELPEHHKKVAERTINQAKRLVESGKDVVILLDSITRLSRAYNLVITPSGRTLSGGLDPAALYGPKKFFGAARNIREGGSLTILATALVETGSRMDEMIFEEFKGTGNMELVLDRKLSEKRVFPAIDLLKSGTRRDDLLLSPEEYATMDMMRKAVSDLKPEEATEKILNLFNITKSNHEFVETAKKYLAQ